jgi:DNA helicase-2/ATP-dependent DNA helicase PcrA
MPLMSAAAQVARIPAIKGKAAPGLKDFCKLIAGLRTLLDLPADEVIRQVIDLSGYRAMLSSSGDPEDADRLANIEELVTAAQQFDSGDSDRSLGHFLERITLASDVDSWNDQQECISIMTLHSSKGLEFPVVYVLAVENGILPHDRSMREGEDDTEEERRLLFVGMTRAMKELYLCNARLREFRGEARYVIPSGFLSELSGDIDHQEMSRHAGRNPAHDHYRGGNDAAERAWAETGVPMRGPIVGAIGATTHADYSVGQIVQHDQYGIGQITEVSGFGALRRVKIRFAAHGLKTFVADKVKLKVASRK